MTYFFDLDGTLADTAADIVLAWKVSLREMNLHCEDFEKRFVAGPPIEEMFRRLFPLEYTDELAAELRRRFGEHYDHDGFPKTWEYPGMRERILELKAGGAKVYVVTNKRYAGAMAMAAKFGWNEIFDGIYAGDMYADDPSVGKLRKPELLARVIAEIGADKSECVMIGDTASDFEAAKANGIASIAVWWGYGTVEEIAMADKAAQRPEEIV